MSFSTLGLAPALLESVRACGYETPTPIQAQAIPHLLTGRDLMGCAQTGTGKTAAFALPILHQIRDEKRGELRALVLVPTRELAMQVGRSMKDYGEPLGVRSTSVFGGVPIGPQEMMLRHGVDILVATPGRLKDLLWRGLIDFRATRFLVLDEADRMLDMGFIDDVREIVALIPAERQTMLFSATLEPEIQRLARDLLRSPVRVEVTPPATVAEGVHHVIVPVRPGAKKEALEDLLRRPEMRRTLVFTRTKRGAQQLAVHLQRRGHRATSIHADKSQSQRVAALEGFRAGRVDLLVATDIAARGLDVEGISHVVNFDVPLHAEDYVHRIGRTARAGKKGMAISLVAPQDQDAVRSIEKLLGRRLATMDGALAAAPAASPAGAGNRAAPATPRSSGTSRSSATSRPSGTVRRSGETGRQRAPRAAESGRTSTDTGRTRPAAAPAVTVIGSRNRETSLAPAGAPSRRAGQTPAGRPREAGPERRRRSSDDRRSAGRELQPSLSRERQRDDRPSERRPSNRRRRPGEGRTSSARSLPPRADRERAGGLRKMLDLLGFQWAR